MATAIIGNITFDKLYNVDKLPQDSYVAKVISNSTHFGGRAANIAVALGKLGCSPLLFGVAGKDFVELGYADELRRNNVDVTNIRIFEEELTAEYLSITAPNDKSIAFFTPNSEGPHYDSYLASFENFSGFTQVCLAKLGENKVTENFIKKFKSRAETSLIVALGPDIRRASASLCQAICSTADLLIMNNFEAKVLSNKLELNSSSELANWRPNDGVTIVTRGKQGSTLLMGSTRKEEFPPWPVSSEMFKNDLGAGDAFVAGYIYGLQKGLGEEGAIQFASLVSSYAIRSISAQPELPSGVSLLKILKKNL